MTSRRPLIACALLTGALCTSAVALAAAPLSASSVALKKSDVPAGYTLKSQNLTNAGMVSFSGIPKAQFDQHGRITGLQNTFTRGNYGIVSFVSQYKTAAGAAWEYGKSSPSDVHHGKAVATPRVGDRSLGFTQTTTSHGVKITAYGIDFQKGVYDMTAVVFGPAGKTSISSAAHYAQIMAGRAH